MNQLAHDWIYWETGKVTFEARREIVYKRLVPASVVIICGAIALVLWKLLRPNATYIVDLKSARVDVLLAHEHVGKRDDAAFVRD